MAEKDPQSNYTNQIGGLAALLSAATAIFVLVISADEGAKLWAIIPGAVMLFVAFWLGVIIGKSRQEK